MDDQQPEAKDGDNINVGNIENSNVVAVGVGADFLLIQAERTLLLAVSVPTAILFPNLASKQMQAVHLASTRAAWVSKESLSPVCTSNQACNQ